MSSQRADRPGKQRRRPTLADVAREAGVSPALVSMVLSGRPGPSAASAAGVMDVAARMGYRPDRAASLLARRHTGQIGVTVTPSSAYHGTVVEEILAHAHDAGFDVVLSPVSPRHDYRQSLEALTNSRCEVLILLNPPLSAAEIQHLAAGTPTVCFGRPLAVPHVDVVRLDDAAAMELLVDHLTSLGHRHIAHVDGGDQELALERLRGYAEAMRRRGLTPLVYSGGETPEHGARAVARLSGPLPFTAVIAFNDLSAAGIHDQLTRHGYRVPHDVSLTGVDDDWFSGLAALDLTTIDPEPLTQARLSVDLALERLQEGRDRRVTRTVQPRLVTRGSTVPPPRTAQHS